MKRLFIRLFLALFLTLAGSAILLDYLYAQAQSDDATASDIGALWLQYPAPAAREENASNLTIAELHWPEKTLQKLLHDRYLLLGDEEGDDGARYFYGLAADGISVQVVKLPVASDHHHAIWLFGFYAMLGLAIFFWLRPLVRDIDRLQTAVNALHLPQDDLHIPLNSRSALTPVAEALTQLRQRTLDLMALQRDIANAVSHDIRTPLARIRFALAMLPPQTDAAMLDSIRSDIAEIEKLTNEMLRYAQFEHSRPALELTVLPLRECVAGFVARYQHQVHVQFRIAIDDSAELLFDRDCLIRVLQNLIDNALRYAQAQICIRWRVENDQQELCVEDDGPGLPQQAGDLSAEFAQAEVQATHYGLGLAIVKKIALWHGAELQLDRSEELGGAAIGLVWRNAQDLS